MAAEKFLITVRTSQNAIKTMQLTLVSTSLRAPAPTMVALDKKETGFCYGLPGSIAPAGQFDPLGFSSKVDLLEMNRLRECELTHGRVGMLYEKRRANPWHRMLQRASAYVCCC